MLPEIQIKETKPISIEGGYLIDGFPSAGFTSAIVTESLIQTSQFELAGIIDSDSFPPVSIIKNGKPGYPTRIYVNNELNVGIFSSYLTLNELHHRVVAKKMLEWASKHKVSYVLSSVAVKAPNDAGKIFAVANTDAARNKLKEAQIPMLEHGTIPGIPGLLLNEGMYNDQNVIVILYNTDGKGPDFKSSAELCMIMSKLIPGAACDITKLQNEAENVEKEIKETESETRRLKDSMYG